MVNKVSKDVKAILEKVKVLAESKKAMKEELSRVQEALENMTEKEFQLLGAMKAGVKMTKEELEKNKLVETNPGLLDDATCIAINKPILHNLPMKMCHLVHSLPILKLSILTSLPYC